MRSDRCCCDYESASTRCAVTTHIPRPLAPARGRRGDALGRWSDKSDKSDRSDKSDKSDKSVVGTETNHTVVAWDCDPVRGDRCCCDYQSASTRCAVTTLIPRPLAPASGRRGGALGWVGWPRDAALPPEVKGEARLGESERSHSSIGLESAMD